MGSQRPRADSSPSGAWSDQLLAAAVIEPVGAVRASADATSGFSDVELA